MKYFFRSTFGAGIACFVVVGTVFTIAPFQVFATADLESFIAKPHVRAFGSASTVPKGLTPEQVRKVYNLPAVRPLRLVPSVATSTPTIAIIVAYDNPTIEKDLAVFSAEFKLPPCTFENKCLEKHLMAPKLKNDAGWSLESALDVEWAHAIAPEAKILLVEAKSASGPHLLEAVDYARNRPDVKAISLSWGGKEFPGEIDLNHHFISSSGAVFFVSSGDSGTGINWPAVSPNVVAVGGTSLNFKKDGSLLSEKAWSGSGGGVSQFELQPKFQADYNISRTGGKRAVPDVSYNADPKTGFSVFTTATKQNKKGWYVLGGTSAGAPQWAAIHALGGTASNEKFYSDKASSSHDSFFRDITSGKNGDCKFFCTARKHYDYVTGLGSPLTIHF